MQACITLKVFDGQWGRDAAKQSFSLPVAGRSWRRWRYIIEHARTHIHQHEHTHTDTYTRKHSQTHTYTPYTCTHARPHACTQYIHTRARTYEHTYTFIHTHAHTHTHTRTHTHTQTHTHTDRLHSTHAHKHTSQYACTQTLFTYIYWHIRWIHTRTICTGDVNQLLIRHGEEGTTDDVLIRFGVQCTVHWEWK